MADHVPAKFVGNTLGFVLQMAGVEFVQLEGALRQLLRAGFPKIGYPQRKQLPNLFGRGGLGDGNQSHFRRLAFRFRGKSGQEHDIAIGDARLARIVRRCQQLPGQNLLQYIDEAGAVHPLDSGLVNDYLRERMGDEFTAKDFRTWGGTLAAMSILARTPLPEDADDATARDRSFAQREKAAVVEVAALLGNSVAVCRKSYIHPEVFAAWRDGSLARAIPQGGSLRQLEYRALAFLKRRMRKMCRPGQ